MKLKSTLATLAITASLGLSHAVFAADAAEAIEAIKEAKKAQQATAEVGFEWRDFGKMIKKAEKLAKEGKSDKAIELAKLVVTESKQALKQAEVAKTAGPHF